MKKLINFNSLFVLIVVLLLMGLIGCSGLSDGTPVEKKVYVTIKSLEAAKVFRTNGLEAAKVFWDQGLMSVETKDKVVQVANDLQFAINSIARAMKIYNSSNGTQGGADVDDWLQIYQQIYGEFTDLVMPFLIERMEVSNG